MLDQHEKMSFHGGMMKSNREINRNFIKELQDWYIEQCNDDWEHSYGVRIDTLDNPGWDISIDLNDTRWSDIEISLNRFDDSDLNWYQYQVAGGKYLACGGPFLLEKLIQIFFDEVVSARP